MTTATSLQRELFDLEKQYWEVSVRGDADAIGRLTADDFTFVMAEGISRYNRAQFVDMMKREAPKMTGYSVDDGSLNAHQLASGVVMLNYRSHVEYTDGGRQHSADSYTTSIWTQRDGTWRCSAAIDTPLATR